MNLGKVDLCPATPMKNLNLYRLVPSMLWSVVIWKQIPTSYILFLTDKRTDACSRSLCYTLRFLTNKKRQKHEKKIPPPQKKKKRNYLYPMQLFSAVATMFSKQFFCPQKFEKLPQKLLIISPNLLFHSSALPTAQN